ncbi:MAG: magnesium transporter [Desulfobacter postgatei]|uniref:magnesium transporter n=1 Tax=Desulfobacter postgatei TaxID=2293 RepID=UPI0023F45D59|nr:magnesium transporter [Desulfobacter postgatei]MDD4273866.1 magnesium transporter [Desulfobacter postgatei]
MQKEQIQILETSIIRLLRRGANKQLLNIIKKTHMADLSIVFENLTPPNQEKLFKLLDNPDDIGLLFSHLSEKTFVEFVKILDFDKLVTVFDHMASDDAAELLGCLDEELSDKILSKMKKEESYNVEQIMSYEEDTAGSLMVKDYVALEEDVKAREVIEALQNKYLDVEMPFYIYVIDNYGKLVGVSSLRQLVLESPDKPLKSFMATDIVSVKPYTDRDVVARLVSRYDFLAIPVVDDDNRIIGIVTVDDVIDILHETATEDMLKMAGVGEDYVETQSLLKGTRIRLPWLFASCLGGIANFFIIGRFESTLAQLTGLAAFIPIIMGMGGNIGTQSATIVVRGIATGRINIRDFVKIISRELGVGFILGVTYGGLIAAVAKFSFMAEPFSWALSVVVGGSILSSMTVAAFVGTAVPLIFHRLNIDPAVATGPFVTTTMDLISVYFYFTITRMLLGF